MPYHMPVPASSYGWGWWQIEGAIDLLNQTMDQAVADAQTALPGDAKRLIRIQAQWDPNADPSTTTDELPRFNMGSWSTRVESPACVPAESGCTSGGTGDYGWSAQYSCGWTSHDVDGPSPQSTGLQYEDSGLTESINCYGEPWIITTDTGSHPNTAGYERFAAVLENVAAERNLVPALP